MAGVDRLTVYPVKALEGTDRATARVTPGGTLAHDRAFALLADDGDPINGKRTDRVHDVRARYDLEAGTATVSVPGEHPERTFDLATERAAAAAWFADVFGEPVTLRHDADAGFPDRDGTVSVVSTATLEAVASWFDGMAVESVRRRLRANVEVSGVPAFWEDRLLGPDAPDLVVGDDGADSPGVRFEGVEPCGRCVVPERDPDTGEATPGFRERFVERRRETLPAWADPAAFEHFYAVMVIARVPPPSRGRTIQVGDDVTTQGA